MKIGILTLPLTKNFGGILQAYALQKFLKSMGHDVLLLDRRYNETYLDNFKFFVKKCLFRKKYNFIQNLRFIEKKPRYFIDKYINPKTLRIISEKSLKHTIDKESFDAVIVGSDQVWRLEYLGDLRYNYFLDFLEKRNVKKYSYAASFGCSDWEHDRDTTLKVKNLLAQFDGVSVREDSGVSICKNIFGINAFHHIDPTLLLTKEDYIELTFNEDEPSRQGGILVYILDIDPDKKRLIGEISKRLSEKVFYINSKDKNETENIAEQAYPSVTSWLKGFDDAKFVITDSFHGTLFSILYNKPFITYGNVIRGLSRFTSVLDLFDLRERLILDSSKIDEIDVSENIDWARVNQILDERRRVASEYLKSI